MAPHADAGASLRLVEFAVAEEAGRRAAPSPVIEGAGALDAGYGIRQSVEAPPADRIAADPAFAAGPELDPPDGGVGLLDPLERGGFETHEDVVPLGFDSPILRVGAVRGAEIALVDRERCARFRAPTSEPLAISPPIRHAIRPT